MFARIAEGRRRLRHGTRAVSRQVDIGKGRIFVDHGFQWDGVDNVWMTRARASYVIAAGPVFDIRPRSILSRMTGIQPGSSNGDKFFEDFFVVRTDTPEDTWAALTTRVRSLLVGAFEDARLVSDGKFVTLWREASFGLESDSEAAAELVSEIIHFRSDIFAPYRHMPGCMYRPPSGPWDKRSRPTLQFCTPTQVDIYTELLNGRPTIVASAKRNRHLEPFWLQIANDQTVRTNAERLPRFLGKILETTGPCLLRCTADNITLAWRHLNVSRLQLTAGAHLVGSFANNQHMYR